AVIEGTESAGVVGFAGVGVGDKGNPAVHVGGEVVLRSKPKPVEAAVISAAAERQAAGVRAAERGEHAPHAETTLVAEPFAVDAPLATASHVPVEVAVDAVPLGGPTGNHGVMLRAKVALQNSRHVVRELAGIDRSLEVPSSVA